MSAFHSPEYIEHLKHVAPKLLADNGMLKSAAEKQIELTSSAITASAAKEDFKVGENDCPIFSGMYEFS